MSNYRRSPMAFAVLVTSLALALTSAGSVYASHSHKSGTVYVCPAGKCYFTPEAAKMMGYKDPMGHKLIKTDHIPKGYTNGASMAKTAGSTVYVCRQCHEYFTPEAAKKLGYKDDMGHPLVKTDKTPAGYAKAPDMPKPAPMPEMSDHGSM